MLDNKSQRESTTCLNISVCLLFIVMIGSCMMNTCGMFNTLMSDVRLRVCCWFWFQLIWWFKYFLAKQVWPEAAHLSSIIIRKYRGISLVTTVYYLSLATIVIQNRMVILRYFAMAWYSYEHDNYFKVLPRSGVFVIDPQNRIILKSKRQLHIF